MIGGKPITVQMPAGNQRTLTLVGNQVGTMTGTVGKLVCLPNSTVATTAAEPHKLMVVSRPRQPSATIASASFDSPATTDAALAALAAEAGLIDPESNSKFETDTQTSFADSGVTSMTSSQISEAAASETTESNADVPMELGTDQDVSIDNCHEETLENLEMEVSGSGNNNASLEGQNSVVGLFGGTRKLGLKGGGKFKLGLLGGSPSLTMPKGPVMWRKGLFGGGNGDSETSTNPQISTNIFTNATEAVSLGTNFSETPAASNFTNSTDTNMTVDNSTLALDIKNEYEEEEEFKLQFHPDDDTNEQKQADFSSSEALVKEEFAERIKQEINEEENAIINGSNTSEFDGNKKDEPGGDALSTLASAALGRATPQTYTKADTVRH